ncbi:MAG: single-stranded DNA-binding protein [Patescibacteria group bacterium]|nr:single-stranded DNA-binding protein [Patescibacteria group bacterium]
MNLNKAMIIGNLTRDPEVKNIPSGQTVATFSVATNFVWTDQSGQKQERVEFHNIVAWRRLAEICGQYLRKGAKVFIEGRIQTRDWLGQDGVKRYRTEIIAENMIMLDRAGGGTGYGAAASPSRPPMPTEQPSYPSEPIIDSEQPVGGGDNPEEEEIEVENIPF